VVGQLGGGWGKELQSKSWKMYGGWGWSPILVEEGSGSLAIAAPVCVVDWLTVLIGGGRNLELEVKMLGVLFIGKL
jgi:hypothetical protein